MKRVLILLTLIAFGLVSCKTTEKPSYAGTDGDYVNGTPLPQRQEGVSFLSNSVQKGQFSPVYFAFDSFEISAQEGEKLRRLADFLKGARNNIILAGFTDERGTPEYNRALESAEHKQHETFFSHSVFRPLEFKPSASARKCPLILAIPSQHGQRIGE